MWFWPQKDGSVTYTGSFNKEQWDAYMAEHEAKPKPAKTEPKPEPEPEPEVEPDSYEDWTVVQLKEEIAARNEGRDDSDHLSTAGNKADLIATLEADDEEGD